jgi:hypothetical protein
VLDGIAARHYVRRARGSRAAAGQERKANRASPDGALAMENPENPGKAARLGNALWFLTWALASSLWCVTAARELGPTYDEPVHLRLGLRYWRAGDHRDLVAGGGTMPLPVDVFTLPIFLWERWNGVAFDVSADFERILPVARSVMLTFWWLLLAYGWRTGKALGGPWGGRLAVALLASEPVLLGHASLATADVALSACLLALAYHYHQGRERRWLARIGLPAFWFGMAFLAKVSGLGFGLLCLGFVEWEHLRRDGGWRRWPGSLRDLSLVVTGGLLLAAFWCGDDRDPYRPLSLAWAPEGLMGQTITWLAGRIRSMPNAYHALQFQVGHNRVGHGNVFLFGETGAGSPWYYPLALSVKLTLTLLLLPLAIVTLRPRALLNWAFLCALAMLALTPACKVQLGIRLILPLVVFAEVGLAAALFRAWQMEAGRRRRGVLIGLGGAGVLWSAWSAAAIWPHGLCYTNELWGGTAEGYRLLSDSNYDWGQGLPELARWQQQKGLRSMDVWYYGTDPALFRLPLRELSWNALASRGVERLRACLRGRFFAASTTMLYGAGSNDPAARFLRSCAPVARTTTFLIYDFTRMEGP